MSAPKKAAESTVLLDELDGEKVRAGEFVVKPYENLSIVHNNFSVVYGERKSRLHIELHDVRIQNLTIYPRSKKARLRVHLTTQQALELHRGLVLPIASIVKENLDRLYPNHEVRKDSTCLELLQPLIQSDDNFHDYITLDYPVVHNYGDASTNPRICTTIGVDGKAVPCQELQGHTAEVLVFEVENVVTTDTRTMGRKTRIDCMVRYLQADTEARAPIRITGKKRPLDDPAQHTGEEAESAPTPPPEQKPADKPYTPYKRLKR